MSIDKIASHYGFTKLPFDRGLGVGALHRSAGHTQAVARLRWLIGTRSLGVLTGDVGAGKTVAVRAATSDLDASRYTVIYLANPTIGARGIHGAVVSALGHRPRFHHAMLVPQTSHALAIEAAERQRHVILIVDEAHLLDASQLEAVRMLTNAQMDSSSHLSVLLVGQPTLRHRLKLGDMAAVDQRVTIRYHLGGMTEQETKAYIGHHLGHSGRSDTMFTDDAISSIHSTARGIPRAINNIAILAFFAAYTTDKTIVDEACARTAVAEFNANDLSAPEFAPPE